MILQKMNIILYKRLVVQNRIEAIWFLFLTEERADHTKGEF